MPKSTEWKSVKGGEGATRKSSRGNTIHVQHTPQGEVKHLNRKDGSSERLRSETPDPRKPT